MTYQNQGAMNLIDDKGDNYSYSLESITYEQPVKKSLLHYIKNPNKHIYRYDTGSSHPNQPKPVKDAKIPILTYSSNRPLNLQEKVIQKLRRNNKTNTLNNYLSVPKLQSIPKTIDIRKLSHSNTAEKELPSVFAFKRDEGSHPSVTFGS